MNRLKKGHVIVSVALLLLFSLFLGAIGGCAKDPAPDGETGDGSVTTTTAITSAETTTAEPTEISLLDENGKAKFRIVRPESGSDTEVNAGIELNKALKTLTGATFTLTTDFLMPKETLESVADVCEILLGATNREQSVQAREGLASHEYVIAVKGSKIVIVGGSDAATYQAMQAFLTMLETGGNFMLAKDTEIKAEIESQGYLVALTNQGESMLEVYDISNGKLDDSSRVWSYKMPYSNIAGTKFRRSAEFGEVALAVCGGSYGCMISYPEGELLWYTESAANNPHSIELMPNGVIAIASSTGNEVRFFTTTEKFAKKPAAIMTLTDAHGVLWDDQNQVLWAVGRAVLTAYRVTLNADNTVTVTEDTSRRVTIPSDHAHDLAPVYGDTNALWITTGSHVYRFDKITKTFSTDYDGHESLDRSAVKGVGNFADGSLVFIYPDGAFQSWTSRSMILLRNQDGKMLREELVSETGHFYKVRVWDVNYQ